MNESEDGHRSTGAQDERLETRALVPYDYRSDEIDLVDVGVSLWRRWKLMVVVFLICLGLGLALAFIIPRPYNYRSVIQLATYTKQNGTTVPVISPGAAIAALNNGFIPTALMQYAQAHEIDPRGIEIEASTAGAGSVGSVI
ncbi:MAG: Wzz/FepE/Etk N-terminal domain-containing protein, partial [Terriglobia bacterium]